MTESELTGVAGFTIAAEPNGGALRTLTNIRSKPTGEGSHFGSFMLRNITDGEKVGTVRVASGQLHGKPAQLVILDPLFPELLWELAPEGFKVIALVNNGQPHKKLFGELDAAGISARASWARGAKVYGIKYDVVCGSGARKQAIRTDTVAHNIVGLECKPRPAMTKTAPVAAPDPLAGMRLTSDEVCVGSTNKMPSWVVRTR